MSEKELYLLLLHNRLTPDLAENKQTFLISVSMGLEPGHGSLGTNGSGLSRGYGQVVGGAVVPPEGSTGR